MRGQPTVLGISNPGEIASRAGLWDTVYSSDKLTRQIYADDTTVHRGVRYLTHPDIKLVEDWGCGYGGLRNYLSPEIRYRGVDGSHSKFADIVADLENYRGSVDAIFLRHVIEHNPRWQIVLKNALESFRRRMVLILFTPYQDKTKVLREYPNWENTGVSMWDIGFARADIISQFGSLNWGAEENLHTQTGYGVEHIFYLER